MEKSTECYFLKWGSFGSEFADEAQKLLEEEVMVDVTLAADGKFLQAHKLVLSICSPYFKNLFKGNPCKHPIVFIKDVKYEILNYLLEFMYKGEVGVQFDELSDFMNLGENLKIRGLAGKSQNKEDIKLNNECQTNEQKSIPPVSEAEEGNIEKRRKLKNKSNQGLNNSKRHSAKKKRKIDCNVGETDSYANEPIPSDSDSDSDPLVKLVMQNQRDEINQKCNDMLDHNQEDSIANDITPDFDFQEAIECHVKHEVSDQGLQGFASKRSRYSILWSWFEKNNDLVKCLLCPTILKFHSTGQLSRHLRSRHPEQYSSFAEAKFPTRPPMVGFNSRSSLVWKHFKPNGHNSECLICGKILKGKYHTNAENHLKSKHVPAFVEYLREKKQQKEETIKHFYGVFNAKI